ncbi:MAG: 16S rRNA (guanine(527)-N(7))-methyltransferase RsmG [Chloroflexi bacterium]|nr:16S rRNA (guanine(527)-N(7))-methyltransferase RsmG [Chloroflexota bacterium]MCI0726681.1 16S rRNA (guanine(527)-N(7))-methyltransferase RsmG [Chloroflexota bacterium]
MTRKSRSWNVAVSFLAEGAAAWGLELTAGQLAHFARYQELLLAWNERLNLTAITGPADIQVRHFLDSLSCTLVTGDLTGQRVVDVGAGAGFPGLPLKILYPGLQLVLVESMVKKTRFLEAVVADLGLQDVAILAERAETLGQQATHRGRYDWAVARAVAAMAVLAEYLLPLCRPGGRMLAQKGPGAAEETQAAAEAIRLLGGGPASLHAVRLPGREEGRVLVVVEKVGETPARYPRRPGIPAKRPLGG